MQLIENKCQLRGQAPSQFERIRWFIRMLPKLWALSKKWARVVDLVGVDNVVKHPTFSLDDE